MSDLVDRLRFGDSTGDDHDDAADEIERLRQRLAEAEAERDALRNWQRRACAALDGALGVDHPDRELIAAVHPTLDR